MDLNFENLFWLEILSDHLDFIYDNLSSSEIDTIKIVQSLKSELKSLKNFIININKEKISTMLRVVNNILELKKDLLHRRLTNTIKLGLEPTFINHMITEIKEYINILQAAIENTLPDNNPIHLHLVWLPDAAGHATSVACQLDPIELLDHKLLMKKKKGFKVLYSKATEFAGYLRATNLLNTPQMKSLNDEALTLTEAFIKHLFELGVLRRSGAKLVTVSTQMINHMIREELYYLRKLGYEVRDPLSPELLLK